MWLWLSRTIYSRAVQSTSITVLQAIIGIVVTIVGFTGKPVVHLGKFKARPMTRLGQGLVFGSFGMAILLPAVLLIVGQQVGGVHLRQWSSALNRDASLLKLVIGAMFLYMSFAVKKLSTGNPLHVTMFKACTLGAGTTLLATSAYFIALRLP
jgi:hypothetical protein